MSFQITTAFVEQYKANVYHLVQQKGSKLRGSVRIESITGENAFFDQIGSVAAQLRVSRHSDTPRMDTPHSRRRVSLADYVWSDLIDKQDKVRMLIDPTSEYAQAAMWALGRSMDDVILAAVDGTAYTGVDGSTQTSYDSNMTVDVQTVWPGVTAADTGLNLAKLIECRKKLAENDVDPDEEVYVAVNGRQISSLLKDERVVSGDYNSALPLVSGQISKVGGCTLVPCNRITTDSNGDDKVPFWTRSGLLLATGQDMMGRISERDDKNYSTQVYASMSIGATRMEEKRVGYIECDPGASPITDA
ncbi:phage capsid protein [Nitratireductor indicus]|uniref:phage capsid protein n=1 Tax=Nitratireductor indicus TaxID=721133 RepID=UPI002875549B|nr:phage capsid protein [Nitratireductor indicus]MDS1138583.1 phage capsid protein [Nitratireductor indicus]